MDRLTDFLPFVIFIKRYREYHLNNKYLSLSYLNSSYVNSFKISFFNSLTKDKYDIFRPNCHWGINTSVSGLLMDYATLAFEHAPAPMVVLSYRFIKHCNMAFGELFGYPRDQLLNCSMRKLFPSTQDFEKIGNEALSSLTLQSGQNYSDQRFMRHRSGEIFWTQTFGRTLTPEDPFKLAIWHFEKKTPDPGISQHLTWRET